MNKKKIIIGTGGTGGHIFPAESLFENLKENFNVQIITDKRGFKFIKDKNNLKVIDTVSISNKGTSTKLRFDKLGCGTCKFFS